MTAASRAIQSILDEAREQLAERLALDSREARLEARMLLQHVFKVDHAWLLSHGQDPLDTPSASQFQALLDKRLAGEPMAYILGHREFFGLDLTVTRDTLIPRPDTEILVEAALACIPENATCRVLDLGTGTGAIALAIAHTRHQASVLATDFSETALGIAQANADRLNIRNVSFLHSDWFSRLAGQTFDLIVSNPPYIATEDVHLSKGDLRFEPRAALASGKNGLDDLEKIISNAVTYLKPAGWLMLEHGYNQAEQVTGLLKQTGFRNIRHERDLSGILRVTCAQS